MNIIHQVTPPTTAAKQKMSTAAEQQIEAQEQLSLGRSILLHLVPGAIITILFYFLAPPLKVLGWPTLNFTFTLCALAVLLPTLFHLLQLGKKRNGKLSLKGVVLYRQTLPWWQYVVFALLVLVYAVLVSLPLGPLQKMITQAFAWWPVYGLRLDTGTYPATHLFLAQILGFALNGFVGPIMEELYFRGYLLPRLSRLGVWAPVLNMVLFSLYHLWQPWNNLENMFVMLPLVFLPWKKRNVYLAIVLHCTLNLFGMTLMLLAHH
ncbi:MAG: CPBP family intramembrane metalloprotease [Chloroflexota bacterium]|nr:CPBP family intramembrane metalloprotease [Chloroflexota bacterium]